MVAKTFQNLPQIGEPFESGGKMYVNVQSKNGNVRRVRWYEIYEYLKMYPDTPREEIDPNLKPLQYLFCADYDYTWIFKGVKDNDEILCANRYAWYHTYWGWYVRPDAPDEEIKNLQKQFEMKKLYWSIISIDNNTLKSKEEVKKIVKGVLNS